MRSIVILLCGLGFAAGVALHFAADAGLLIFD